MKHTNARTLGLALLLGGLQTATAQQQQQHLSKDTTRTLQEVQVT
ncbi:hypothetical protein GA0116948_105288 [Chitinophaga costaii]|uniref:Uncharacterized protein n=1 Tax=Chitinophaga costaii TaxID=1335309 RepID=A0A1C4DI77_9BACT|nr:hypothetical protein [Chitinophaga costaii]SCC31062.1 hypothetical protein GA0116948_105288 [Chitinophaga costaii]